MKHIVWNKKEPKKSINKYDPRFPQDQGNQSHFQQHGQYQEPYVVEQPPPHQEQQKTIVKEYYYPEYQNQEPPGSHKIDVEHHFPKNFNPFSGTQPNQNTNHEWTAPPPPLEKERSIKDYFIIAGCFPTLVSIWAGFGGAGVHGGLSFIIAILGTFLWYRFTKREPIIGIGALLSFFVFMAFASTL